MDKQDEYDDSFASGGKSTSTSTYSLELECPIAANLQKVLTTVDEEDSWFYSGQNWKKILQFRLENKK